MITVRISILSPNMKCNQLISLACQHTLHCTIIEKGGKIEYCYHLSDDTIHDSAMTFHILIDILEHNEEIAKSGHLVLRTDNCSVQYKSKYVFYKMKELAEKYQIIFSWFYGEPGHRRGLVDAMTHFGCKRPLRDSIIINNELYDTAEEMTEYLKQHFEKLKDFTKIFHLPDSTKTAQKRVCHNEHVNEHVLPGCRKMHLISVDAQGQFATLVIIDGSNKLLNLEFSTDENNPIPFTITENEIDDILNTANPQDNIFYLKQFNLHHMSLFHHLIIPMSFSIF